MHVTIDLPPEAASTLTKRAQGAGIDVPTYVERVLQVELSRPPIDEILRPVREAFAESGMSEDELSNMLVKAKKEMRSARRGGTAK